MRGSSTVTCSIATLIGLASWGVWFLVSASPTPVAIAQDAEKPRPSKAHRVEPVEGDMHEFMGHLCEPTYRRLKQSLATKPTTQEAWKGVASDALILAETGNLLLARSPDSTSDIWPSDASGIRTFGAFVYRAAREQDYQNAVFYYRHMVEQCNDCHRANGAGDKRLEP